MAARITEEDLARYPQLRKAIEQASNTMQQANEPPKISSKPLKDMDRIDFIIFQLACVDPSDLFKVERTLNNLTSVQAKSNIKKNLTEIRNSVEWLYGKVK